MSSQDWQFHKSHWFKGYDVKYDTPWNARPPSDRWCDWGGDVDQEPQVDRSSTWSAAPDGNVDEEPQADRSSTWSAAPDGNEDEKRAGEDNEPEVTKVTSEKPTEDDEAGDEEECDEEGKERRFDMSPDVQLAYETFLREIDRIDRLEVLSRENGKEWVTVDMVLETARSTKAHPMDAKKERYKALMLLLHPDKYGRYGPLAEDLQRKAKKAYHMVEHYYSLPQPAQGHASASASASASSPGAWGSKKPRHPGACPVANPLRDELTIPDKRCYFRDPETGDNRCILCMKSGKKAFCTINHMESYAHNKRAAEWCGWYAYNRERFAPELDPILTGYGGTRG